MSSKSEIRKTILARRRVREHRTEASLQIADRLRSLREWRNAREVLMYVDIHSEVITQPLLEEAIAIRGSAVVPYCQDGSLVLARIEHPDELAPGMFGVLEPVPGVRESPARRVADSEIDLVLVPGVAFDSDGGRLGYGKGYYDRLLGRMPDETIRIALAFECQLVEQIPREDHDMLMHVIVTESRVLRCLKVPEPGESEE